MAEISRCTGPLHRRCTAVARNVGPSKAVAVAFRVSYTRMLQRQRASRCTGPLHFSLERNHSSPLQVQRAQRRNGTGKMVDGHFANISA